MTGLLLLVLVSVGVLLVALAISHSGHEPDVIHCPVCDSTRLATYNSGMWGYEFRCENGHEFIYDDGGP